MAQLLRPALLKWHFPSDVRIWLCCGSNGGKANQQKKIWEDPGAARNGASSSGEDLTISRSRRFCSVHLLHRLQYNSAARRTSSKIIVEAFRHFSKRSSLLRSIASTVFWQDGRFKNCRRVMVDESTWDRWMVSLAGPVDLRSRCLSWGIVITGSQGEVLV